jgi:hypothetical protein
MPEKHNIWLDGRWYLLQWDVPARITTSGGLRESRCRGEAVFVVRGDHEKTRGLYLDRFGLAASGVEARKAHTGVITVRGLSSVGAVTLGQRVDTFRVEAACDINYESLDRAHGIETDKGCYYIPATEPAAAVLEARAVAQRGRIRLERTRIHVSCAAGRFEEVVAIEVLLKDAVLTAIPAPHVHYRFDDSGAWEPSKDANVDDNVCVGSTRRQLIVQPVGFRDSATDPSPSGSTSAAQLATAQTVWNKACVDLTVRPTVLITNSTLKTSSNLTDIRNAYTDSDPNAIEVFFVANSLPATGGGNAGGIGVASCKPVIAEPNGGNPVLVSHELGHVLNLLHPGTGSNSDPGTVMAPTGSAMVPGTQLVTHIMCTSIANPVLQATTTACCFTHEIPNHYLRDFPTDAGNEPSEPIGAGMNRYAMSNVWNRLTNTPGTPSATTGPEHQSPARFNTDMTPHTNFLFAKIEQLVNLPVRNAVVRFFLKNPGSGGGATNLTLLGEVPVPAGIGVGTPQTVSLPWTVPTGVPNHSCIFGVVRSDAEPEGDQSALDWWQFETLAYNDNDWAQRNLDIENVTSSNSNDSNVYESAPFFINLPPARQRPSPFLTLEIDASFARPLRTLALEVVNVKRINLVPGRRQSVRINTRGVRDRLVLVLHAEVPGRLKVGTRMSVGVNPSMGRRSFVGYGAEFRIAGRRDVVDQMLDVAAAALSDLATLADAPGAHALFCSIGTGNCSRPYSVRDIVDRLVDRRVDLERAQAELSQLGPARLTGADGAMTRLLKALDAYAAGESSAAMVAAAYRAMCNRAMTAAALIRESGASGK